MSERTIIPRRGQDVVVGVPETCPTCRSTQILSEHGEWRCGRSGCFAQSPGWMSRPATSGSASGKAKLDADDSGSGPVEAKPALAAAPEPKDDAASLGSVVASTFRRPRRTHDRTRRFTEAEMLNFLVAYHVEHGVTPSQHAWQKNRPAAAPVHASYANRFGSWNAAIEAAGLPLNRAGGGKKSQPAPAPRIAAPAETAAAAPTSTGPTGVSTPAVEDSDRSPETPASPGVVEQPLPPTYAQTPARLVAARPAAVMYDDGHMESAAESDWREAAQRRFIEALLTGLENTQVVDSDGAVFFEGLCDRIESLLGLIGTEENPA